MTFPIEPQEAQAVTVGPWRVDDHPTDGRPIYVMSFRLVKYTPYKPDGRRQMGTKGRWQEAREYGGWENCPAPDGPWILAGKTMPDSLFLTEAVPDLLSALRAFVAAHKTGRNEPLQIAYEQAIAALSRTHDIQSS